MRLLLDEVQARDALPLHRPMPRDARLRRICTAIVRDHAGRPGALERLAAGERIVDIALNSGYSSQSAFAAMCHRHFGVAPSRFNA